MITQAAPPPSTVLFGLFAAPPIEELAYRGPLLYAVGGLAWLNSRTRLPHWVGPVAAAVTLILTSAAFGHLHADYGQFNVAVTTIHGLLYGVIAWRTRSLIPALVGHGIYNAAVFTLAW